MKILFLCGCLEPGKDGVGDYTRNLAAELSTAGNQVILLALYDQHINNTREDIQKCDDIPLKVFRLSSRDSRKTRLAEAKRKILDFAPQWISLQYVPYSFHPKGMDFRFPLFIEHLKGKHEWHIMVHEPWVRSKNTISKYAIVGFLQKQLLKLLVRSIGPRIIHTSNLFYREILERGGVRSSLLHLPGNIPIKEEIALQMLKEFSELGILGTSQNDWVVLGTFGKIRSNISYLSFFEDLLIRPEIDGKKIAFLSIGNAGKQCDEILSEIRDTFKERILVHKFGERDATEISSFFQLLDFGVASVPHHLLGKSGAYAAMRNHGLKILVPEEKYEKEILPEEGTTRYSEYLLDIPDSDFSSVKVAQDFLFSLITNPNDTFVRKGLHEDFIYHA